MKFTVKVEGKLFEVEIEDLDARPIRVQVEGEWFEIWPESSSSLPGEQKKSTKTKPFQTPSPPLVVLTNGNDRLIRAPLPGTIVNIVAKPGLEVATGQELLVLEAMKMKNTIRSPRDGKISAINVTLGQNVKHQDILVEFAE